jgi:hypothetical protein
MKFSTKLAALVIGFGLAAAPAFALDGTDDPGTTTDTTATDTTATLQPTVTQTPQGPPTTIPPAYGPTDNPGSSHQPPPNARALGRIECQEFKRVFDAPPRNEFGKCIADLAKMIRLDLSPRQACSNMSRKRQEGESRSNFSACVLAGTRALSQIGA